MKLLSLRLWGCNAEHLGQSRIMAEGLGRGVATDMSQLLLKGGRPLNLSSEFEVPLSAV